MQNIWDRELSPFKNKIFSNCKIVLEIDVYSLVGILCSKLFGDQYRKNTSAVGKKRSYLWMIPVPLCQKG